MRDDLLFYYERELAFLRRTGAEFARKYPKVAGRLLLEPTKCDDPHVERLLEGFAFLAARVHLKVDDDYPELSEALLEILFPQYTRPIPSLSTVQFELDPEQGKLTSGLKIPKGTQLLSRPVGGAPCRFQTSYETTLWPVAIEGAQWTGPGQLDPPVRVGDAVAALRIDLQCFPDTDFAKMELDRLRLHISADATLASSVYELLCNNCVRILVRDRSGGRAGTMIELPASSLVPVGFDTEHALLPRAPRTFEGYRLLQEYFAFPEKFFFFDLHGFDRLRAAGFGDRAEVIFLISQFDRVDRKGFLEVGVNESTFRLGCSPVVNIFPQTSEPVPLHQRQHEYLIVPDVRRRDTIGTYAVEEVVAISPGSVEPLKFEPLYSFRHGADENRTRLYWRTVRRAAQWRVDEGTDVYLNLVDLSGRTVYPDLDAATVRLLCHNRDLPSRLPFGSGGSDFELPGGGPIRRIVALTKPTGIVEPALGKPRLWRLISQLSLNYLSLVEGGGEALRELLRLHVFSESHSAEKQIQGIVSVTGEPHYARILSPQGLTFARGHRVEIEFDEEQYAGGGVYLMASVLEHFLGAYVSLNSFCVLAAKTRQRPRLLREWKPRAGARQLL